MQQLLVVPGGVFVDVEVRAQHRREAVRGVLESDARAAARARNMVEERLQGHLLDDLCLGRLVAPIPLDGEACELGEAERRLVLGGLSMLEEGLDRRALPVED